MPILIKSSNGQRKVQMLSRNPEKREDQEPDLRSTLVSLLRGMTITLELKVNDIVIASSSSPVNVEDSIGGGYFEQTVGTETLIQRESEKLDQPGLQVSGKTVGVEQSELTQNSESAPGSTKSGVNFAPLQALKVESEPKELDVKPDPPVMNVKTQPAVKEENLDKEPLEKSKASVASESGQQSKMSPKPVNKAPEPKASDKPFLVCGDLKVGSGLTTIGLSVASEDPLVVYVTYDMKKLVESLYKIQEIAEAIEAQSMCKSVDVGDIIFGKSNEDQTWYRGVVMSTHSQQIETYFFDWGMTEILDITRVRRLTELGLGLAKFPACAVKVKFTDASKPYLDDVLACEKRFSMKVESFDQDQEIYTATVTKILPDE